jgi:hypothetical protein
MTIGKAAAVALVLVTVSALYFVFLAGGWNEYPDVDTSQLDRGELFRVTEELLEDSEAWPAELSADGVSVSSSLEPYPARAVRYSVEVDADFESVVAYVKDENYSGPGRRDKPDKQKYEVTLYENDGDGSPTEWVRRSVHLSPPPGGNRDAVVMYFEDRPDPKTYRIAFQSVETIGGGAVPEVEGAVRFKVLPSIYKVEEIAPGRVRVRKVEGVDPRGALSSAMNNYFISLVFFRNYMFEQAVDMRETLGGARG